MLTSLLWLAGCPSSPPVPVEAQVAGSPAQAGAGWTCLEGLAARAAVVPPGRYESALSLSQREFHTREMVESRAVQGHLSLELREDSTFEACLAATLWRSGSISHLASPDGQDHRHKDEDQRIRALRGRWAPRSDGLALTVEQQSWSGCARTKEGGPPQWSPSQGELACGLLSASASLPVPALACLLDAELHLEDLALELGPRPGPWHRIDTQPVSGERCGPWLLLGAMPGLSVRWAQERTPGVLELSSGVPAFEEATFFR